MKLELEMGEKRILVLIGKAANHNNVELTEVTDKMFEEELGQAVKHFLFKQLSHSFHEDMQDDHSFVDAFLDEWSMKNGSKR